MLMIGYQRGLSRRPSQSTRTGFGKNIPKLEISDRWKFVKDATVPKNKKDVDLSGEHMMKIIRRYQINSHFALLKQMADCYKGEKASGLLKSHLTTPGGEFWLYKTELRVALDEATGRGAYYDHKKSQDLYQ